jgi:uncharacterized membrane protein
VAQTAAPDLPRRVVVLRPPGVAGLIVAAVGYAGALTPSLLPHTLMFLIVLTTLGSLSGYAIGATVGWALRQLPSVRGLRWPTWLIATVLAVVWVPAIAFTGLAVQWQGEQQSALDMPAPLPSAVTVVVLTAIAFTVLLLIGRSLRLATNALAGLVGTIPPIARWLAGEKKQRGPVAVLRFGVAAVLVLLAFGLAQLGLARLVASYDTINADTSGQSPTNLGVNSGSPDSFAPWDTLGRQGRSYVSSTMTPAAITAITDRPAQTPVRVYAGMQQGDTPQARTDLAIKELDRVDAWDRKYLVVFGVTGTGWVDPNAINALETVTDGDVTTVAVQYSAVPSWIGFVIDPQTTMEQNDNTIDGVLAAWRAKPADKRPELILFGQSLGAMGTQSAWGPDATPEQVTEDFPHVVWVGPPAASTLWSSWQASRTGGPAWQPIIGDGKITRVLVSATDPGNLGKKSPPTIVFVAHANDPVVYWSPDLLLNKPDWLEPPLGPGVMPQMRWIPVITFLQVGMDLISGGEPPEVGHNYSANMAGAVALAVDPPGWTAAKTRALEKALPTLLYATD